MKSRGARRGRVVVAAIGGGLVCALALLLAWPHPPQQESALPQPQHSLGPVSSRSVYWVGHSLMNARDPRSQDKRDLMQTVGAFAQSRSQSYASFDQTLWGSPLSLAYRGSPHAYARNEPAFAKRRDELVQHGDRYDTLVMTDTVPIGAAVKYEHSAYYASRFACDLLAKRPDARIYLYESWINLQGQSDDPKSGSAAAWRFTDRLAEERRGYAALADAVTAGQVVEPGLKGRLLRWVRPAAPCALTSPVFLVPVGSALAALHEALRADRFEHDGRALAITDFFANPVLDWPADWPRDDVDAASARAVIAKLPRAHPEEPADDIHPNVRGVYFAALVHYATLYRQSPVGLPVLDSGFTPETAARLQALVWAQVRSDPRTGVLALE